MNRRRDVLTLAAFLPVAAAILVALLRASGSGPLTAPDRELQAVVPSAISLAPAAEVRVAGVAVGRVERLRRRGDEAVVLLGLDRDAPPVFRDATVDIRARTVVGESFVQLTPGSPSAGELPPGVTLAPSSREPATQFDDVASLFDPSTRRRLRAQIRALSGGLGGDAGGDLNRLLGATADAVRDGAPVLAALAGQRVPLARLVDQIGAVTRALGDRDAGIRLLATRATAAVSAVRQERAGLERLLQAAPGVLTQARGTTARLAAFSGHATPPLRDLRAALADLGPALDALPVTARRARATLAELDRTAPRATRLLRRAVTTAPLARADVRPLEQVLAQLNPLLGYLRPYTRELGGFFGNLGSAVSNGDTLGRLIRVSAIVSPGVLATAPKEFVALYDRLKQVGGVAEVTGEHGMNPYPAPGSLLRPEPFTGRYPRVQPAAIPGD